ncbi:hypothetical protein V8E36_008696 [Tilletia maclaganii]
MAASFATAGSATLPALRLLAQEAIVYTRTADNSSAPVCGLLPLSTAAPSGLSSSSSAVAASAGSSRTDANGAAAGASSSTTAITPTQPTISYRQAVSPASHAFDINPGANLVVATDIRSPTLLFWALRSDVLLQRIITPTRLTTVALSPNGDLCAAGSTEGSLFLWQISTGELLASFDAHYRAVTVLSWSPDGNALASGGADSRILIWSLAGLLNPEAQNSLSGPSAATRSSSGQPFAYATLSDHTLPITSLAFPPTSRFPAPGTLWSTSLDGSVKLWDLRTRSLLYTYSTPFPLQHLTVDSLSRFIYVATAPPNAAAVSSLGGSGGDSGSNLSRVIRIDTCRKRSSAGTEYIAQQEGENNDPGSDADGSVIRVRHRITALALSAGSSHLLVGTATSQLHVFDTNTAQTLSVLNLSPSVVSATAGGSNSKSSSTSSMPTLKKGSGNAALDSGNGPGTCYGSGAITNLKMAVLPPVQSRMSAAMGSMSSGASSSLRGKAVGAGEETALPLVASKFGRTVSHASITASKTTQTREDWSESAGVVWARIPRDLEQISSYICPPPSLPSLRDVNIAPRTAFPLPGLFPPTSSKTARTVGEASTADMDASAGNTSRQEELEVEVARLRAQLEEASQLNERLYALVGAGPGT